MTAAVSLESKLAFLRQPNSYAEPVYRVEAIETHMSWVFLTDRHAYKLKKPVRYELLDFSTIEARRFYCEEEVRLNRRLAPSVYLGTIALVIDANGHLHLGGDDSAIDWMVKLRRLPAQRMLDYAIKSGTVQENDITQVAALLARFYCACAHVDIDAASYRRQFQDSIEQNRAVLSTPDYRLPADEVERVCAVQQATLQRVASLLDERVLAHRIVEGHGDLRAEHVCLEHDPLIIDCLEFSQALRTIDALDEVAFLALECERLGAPHFGDLLLHTYCELSAELPNAALIHFYQSFRAGLRARIAIWHLNEEKFRHSAEWPRRAMGYLQLAERHAQAANAALSLTTPATR